MEPRITSDYETLQKNPINPPDRLLWYIFPHFAMIAYVYKSSRDMAGLCLFL